MVNITKKQVIEVLESGKYPPTTGQDVEFNKDGNLCFCALGVILKEAGYEVHTEIGDAEDPEDWFATFTLVRMDSRWLTEDVAKALDIDYDIEKKIYRINDLNPDNPHKAVAQYLRELWDIYD